MSHHIFPCAGRENFLTRRNWDRNKLLEPLSDTSVVNSGWNDPVFVPLSPRLPSMRTEARWESPTVNVLPSAEVKPMTARPFGATKPLARPLPSLPRTPLQSMGARSEHWFSDPIHGVFVNCVPEVDGRWTTSNRNVFRQRDGVTNSGVSSRVMERIANASNGSLQTTEHDFAKPHLSRSQHCWERVNGPYP